jgi:BMFP domain-containing protein YqiC
MKQPDSKIFDDLARVAGGAMNVFSGLREQIMSDVKVRMEEAAAKMDLVPREDFDRLQMQVDSLQKKLDELIGGAKTKTETKTAAKKPAAKKTTEKKPGKKK